MKSKFLKGFGKFVSSVNMNRIDGDTFPISPKFKVCCSTNCRNTS